MSVEPDPQQASPSSAVLFTAFEPSGDALAAPVIRQMLEQSPGLKIYAWGGPHMEEAGATVVEQSARDGAMGLGALAQASAVRREIGRIRRWSKKYRVIAHIAVDSPAANFPICKTMRATGARVIHLVAPQLWAWGRWRLGKLRRLTDLVLCLLPFEEQWFSSRDIPARFIGHPAVNRPLDRDKLRELMHGLPQGAPRLAMFPGSRTGEVRANIRLLADCFAELHDRHHGMAGLFVAANADLARLIRKKIKVFPTGLHMVVGQTDPAIAWCDLALAVSGTITLHIARHRKPMIGVYKTDTISWLGAKLLLRTHLRLLPNITAEREIVPEFVPHIRGAMPIVDEATRYLSDSKHGARQAEELRRVCLRFSNKRPAEESARLILKVMKEGALT